MNCVECVVYLFIFCSPVKLLFLTFLPVYMSSFRSMSYLVKGNVESALEKMFKNDLFQYVLKGPGESQECPEGTTVSEF